jgi:hypothetical protein
MDVTVTAGVEGEEAKEVLTGKVVVYRALPRTPKA